MMSGAMQMTLSRIGRESLNNINTREVLEENRLMIEDQEMASHTKAIRFSAGRSPGRGTSSITCCLSAMERSGIEEPGSKAERPHVDWGG